MYGQNSVMHEVFIYAGLEGIKLISLAVIKFFSYWEPFLRCGDFSPFRRLLGFLESCRT